jgi:hypothetical protein
VDPSEQYCSSTTATARIQHLEMALCCHLADKNGTWPWAKWAVRSYAYVDTMIWSQSYTAARIRIETPAASAVHPPIEFKAQTDVHM